MFSKGTRHLALLAIFGCGLFLGSPLRALPIDEPRAGETWRPFEHPAVLRRTFTGFTRPRRSVEISSEVIGRIVEVCFEKGDVVPEIKETGSASVAVRLDSSLAEQQLRVEQVRLGVSQAEVLISRISVGLSRSELWFREKEFERFQQLFDSKRASERELDAVKFDFEIAEIRVREAEERVKLAESRVLESQAQVALAQEELRRRRIEAPEGWRIEERWAEVGALAQPGEPLLRLVDLSTLRVPLRLAERELRALRKTVNRGESSRPLTLYLPGPGRELTGRVAFVSAEFDPDSQKRLVEIEIDSVDLAEIGVSSSGGLEVRLELDVPEPSSGVTIPARFVRRSLEQAVVKAKSGDLYTVVLLRREGDNWIVLPGPLPPQTELIVPD